LPFESTLNLDPPLTALPPAATNPGQRSPIEQLKANPKLLAISGAVVVVLLAGCGFLFARMKKGSARAAQVHFYVDADVLGSIRSSPASVAT